MYTFPLIFINATRFQSIQEVFLIMKLGYWLALDFFDFLEGSKISFDLQDLKYIYINDEESTEFVHYNVDSKNQIFPLQP